MMQNTPPLAPVPPQTDEVDLTAAPFAQTHDHLATLWVSRVTSFVGLVCLVIALGVWMFHSGHYRLVLALLTVAMFAAILHSYTFENGS